MSRRRVIEQITYLLFIKRLERRCVEVCDS